MTQESVPDKDTPICAVVVAVYDAIIELYDIYWMLGVGLDMKQKW